MQGARHCVIFVGGFSRTGARPSAPHANIKDAVSIIGIVLAPHHKNPSHGS
jgi:hypothetical protein